MANSKDLMPLAKADIVATPVGEELLVYSPESKEGHSLSKQASVVFRACDGHTSKMEVAEILGGGALGRDLLNLALADLAKKGLLDEAPVGNKVSRRQFIARWGTAAAALPLIATVSAPRPAQAQSLISLGNTGCGGDNTQCQGNPPVRCDGNTCCNNSGPAPNTCPAGTDNQCCGIAICQANRCCEKTGTFVGVGIDSAAKCCSNTAPGGFCT